MTDADRAAAPLIYGAFDLAAGAGPAAPAAQTSRALAYSRERYRAACAWSPRRRSGAPAPASMGCAPARLRPRSDLRER
ncbi:hypothetical protein SFRURICE_010785 [Spodoptera frugiperda]|uniref:SFRICE_010727 n=1 Tax=Spodoptera frugiperda TaxID=7108 RepID=A0A2H1WHE9_SPOFR|nr:hypothetical protein SFRURICE_013011 [Spodoptera frugiperda]KAF9817326.1 hypothetical protein SFRURICE_010785 [Spodoptera frugiperda]